MINERIAAWAISLRDAQQRITGLGQGAQPNRTFYMRTGWLADREAVGIDIHLFECRATARAFIKRNRETWRALGFTARAVPVNVALREAALLRDAESMQDNEGASDD